SETGVPGLDMGLHAQGRAHGHRLKRCIPTKRHQQPSGKGHETLVSSRQRLLFLRVVLSAQGGLSDRLQKSVVLRGVHRASLNSTSPGTANAAANLTAAN